MADEADNVDLLNAPDLLKAPEGEDENAVDKSGDDQEADKSDVDSKSEDADGDKDDKEEAGGAPDQYEDFTLPEGMNIDVEALEAFTPVAKELNLSQKQAQKIVDLQIARETAKVEAGAAEMAERFKRWKAEARADKEVGGAKFDQSVGHANLFMNRYMTPSGFEALAASGLQNHPEMLRTFAKAGAAISEDKMVMGNPGGAAPRDAADILYGSNASTE